MNWPLRYIIHLEIDVYLNYFLFRITEIVTRPLKYTLKHLKLLIYGVDQNELGDNLTFWTVTSSNCNIIVSYNISINFYWRDSSFVTKIIARQALKAYWNDEIDYYSAKKIEKTYSYPFQIKGSTLVKHWFSKNRYALFFNHTNSYITCIINDIRYILILYRLNTQSLPSAKHWFFNSILITTTW